MFPQHSYLSRSTPPSLQSAPLSLRLLPFFTEVSGLPLPSLSLPYFLSNPLPHIAHMTDWKYKLITCPQLSCYTTVFREKALSTAQPMCPQWGPSTPSPISFHPFSPSPITKVCNYKTLRSMIPYFKCCMWYTAAVTALILTMMVTVRKDQTADGSMEQTKTIWGFRGGGRATKLKLQEQVWKMNKEKWGAWSCLGSC